ncbi:MAG TPA: pseudouridine synthase [Ottowia sp.]|uniref:pseudouridine synthase n=1 Tax=Ottowia sp. TaxID=1898956 RepID=UPI002C1D46F9|nr:pseudouridine synthase [Ottowia sp.]HMN22122.1 pseudouridine synthase [Ottowia sp.]
MLPIVYQDAHLIAVDKPAGLLVHRSALDAGETRFALQRLRDQVGRRVWPVHRLDRGTSGVLLFALDAASAHALALAFEAGQVRKTYLAVVRGWPPAAGTVDHPLGRLPDDARGPRGIREQPALTQFHTLARHVLPLPDRGFPDTRCALVELQPATGRRHQLRRHCKHMAHPILGDASYGKGALNRAVASCLGISRLWLHALRLELAHPASGAPLVLAAPPDATWSRWLEAGPR